MNSHAQQQQQQQQPESHAGATDSRAPATEPQSLLLRRLWRNPSFRAVLVAFAVTRLLVLALLVLTPQIERATWGSRETVRELKLPLDKVPVSRQLREAALVADVNWYLGIAEGGYHAGPFTDRESRNWAFFPLHPLVWRAASYVTGEWMVTGMALSHVFLFAGLFVLHRLVLASGWDAGVADRTVFYLAAFPVSYFLSLPLTEPLFLLLAASAFYAGTRERWWLAAALGALASATRVIGVLLLPALLLLHWQRHRKVWPPTRAQLALVALAPSGLLAFMWFLHARTGNALAFKDVLVTWGRRPTFFLLTLWNYLQTPFLVASEWDFRLLNFAASVMLLASGAVLLARRRWALAGYTLACIYLSLSSGLLQSQARYATVVFPAFIVLASATAGRPRADQAVRSSFLVALALLTVLFSLRYTPVLS